MALEGMTVIVPVHNRANIVEKTLDSIDAQREPGEMLHLIIVDNNSTDDTLDVVEQWAEARRSTTFDIIVTSETIPGASAARNKGLSLAVTDEVMFFDSDDIMPRGLTATALRGFQDNPTADIVCWQVAESLANGTEKISHLLSRNNFYDAVVHGVFSTQRYAIKRKTILEAGGWDNSVRVWDDLELSVRILMLNPVIVPLKPTELPTIFFSEDSISASMLTAQSGGDSRCEHALDCCENTLATAGRHDLIRWIDYRRILLAADYARNGNRKDGRRLLRTARSLPSLLRYILYYKHRIYPRGTHFLMTHVTGNM